MSISHAERRATRQKAALAVKNGKSPRDVAVELGMRLTQVLRSCRESGVAANGLMSTPKKRSFVILKALLDGKTMSEVAREHGVTHQRIYLIAESAREAGFPIPKKVSQSRQ